MVNRSALAAIIAEWLEEVELPCLIPRNKHEIDFEKLRRVLAIVGPRRAGKTYYMYQIIQSLLGSGKYKKNDILFLDFEDYRLGELASQEMDEIFVVFHQIAGQYPKYLFFDEVQHLPNWQRVIRTLHNRRRFKIIISGSNSKLLGGEIASELRGRYHDIIMFPFSFSEYLRYREISVTSSSLRTAARGKLLAAFDDYIRHGGFPEVILAGSETERRKLLQNYFKTIFYRDILERYNIKARYVLDALMNDVLETYSSIFSISRFEKHLKRNGIAGSKRTISNYLQYLEEAFFLIVNEKFSYSPRRRIMNPKKIYLSDTGFAGLGRPFSENRGRILENVVAAELFRRETEIFYFKESKECDFVLKKGQRPVQAIQVCWELNQRNEKRELNGLLEACRKLGIDTGLILSYSQEGERNMNGFTASVLPVWKWLLIHHTSDVM